MTIPDFQRLLVAFGTDLARWPPAEREAATALLSGSAEAQAVLAQAVALDALLRRHPIAVPPHRAARVAEAALARITARPARRAVAPWVREWLPAFIPPVPAALALLALLGCLLGLRVPLPSAHRDAALAVAVQVLISDDARYPLRACPPAAPGWSS